MRTLEIIKEIKNLPIQKRIFVIEKTIQSIRKLEETNQLRNAAEILYTDYLSDKELTVFTNLDFEHFYEARWDLVINVSADSLGKLPLKVIVPVTDWKDKFEVAPWMVRIDSNSKNGLERITDLYFTAHSQFQS
jgi:hypothetical protein